MKGCHTMFRFASAKVNMGKRASAFRAEAGTFCASQGFSRGMIIMMDAMIMASILLSRSITLVGLYLPVLVILLPQQSFSPDLKRIAAH